MYEAPELDRQQGDQARECVVVEVMHAERRCRVRIAEGFESGPIPWFAFAAGQLKVWRPPAVGEQGMLLAPNGDIARGCFLPGVYSDANPPPSDRADRAVVEYGEIRLSVGEDVLVATNAAGDGGLVLGADHISLRWKNGGVDKFISVDGSQEYGLIHSVDTEWGDVHYDFDRAALTP